MLRSTHDRLSEQLAAQVEQFNTIYEAIDDDTPYDDGSGCDRDAVDALHEAPLEVSIKRSLCVVLACGGPHVEAVAELDEGGSISDLRLIGWWGNAHIANPIDPGSALYRAMENYAETFPS